MRCFPQNIITAARQNPKVKNRSWAGSTGESRQGISYTRVLVTRTFVKDLRYLSTQMSCYMQSCECDTTILNAHDVQL